VGTPAPGSESAPEPRVGALDPGPSEAAEKKKACIASANKALEDLDYEEAALDKSFLADCLLATLIAGFSWIVLYVAGVLLFFFAALVLPEGAPEVPKGVSLFLPIVLATCVGVIYAVSRFKKQRRDRLKVEAKAEEVKAELAANLAALDARIGMQAAEPEGARGGAETEKGGAE
jgi:hypothetical protein